MTQSIIDKLKQENALLKLENSKIGKDIEILKQRNIVLAEEEE
jgi:hypothetical protein